MSINHPQNLTGLTPREAITDALYRALIGFDKSDIPLFNSAFISSPSNVIFELYHGSPTKDPKPTIIHGLDQMRSSLLTMVGPMDTTHMVSNIRIDVRESGKEAEMTAFVMAQHCKEGEGGVLGGRKYLVGGEYAILLECEEGRGWGIRKWVLEVIWRQGDETVLQREA